MKHMANKLLLKDRDTMAETKAIAKIESLAIQKIDPVKVLESLKESGLQGFNPFNFDQIRVPGANSFAFTVKSEDGDDDPMKFLDVVILHFHKVRNYYIKPYDPQNPKAMPPDCVSYDGATGQGNPGGVCARCPLSAFGAGCNPGYFLYLLFPDRTMPVKFNVPRTSIANFESYFGKIGMSGQFMNTIITRIGLEKRKNGEGMIATFKKLSSLPEEVGESARGYARMLSSSLIYNQDDGEEKADPTARRITPQLTAGVSVDDDESSDDDVDY